jgi:hypothetical protein
MPLFALTIVALMIFTAFVVDLGPVYNERRQDQTAADAASLAAGQFLAKGRTAAVTEAMSVARGNLRQTFSDSAWAAMWAGCSDPGRDATAYPDVTPTTPCISFANGSTRVRVRIPTQTLQTSFARVVGINTLSTSANAEAEIDAPAGGGIFPFGLVAYGANLQNQMCAKEPATCGGQSSDDLRILDSPLVGNPQYGTARDCRGTATYTNRIANNAAVGLDHLVVAAGTDPSRLDECDIEIPNTVYGKDFQAFGQSSDYPPFLAALGRGVLTGSSFSDGRPARLRRIPPSSGWPTRAVAGVTVDNRGLWEFIPFGATGVPPSCQRTNFQGVGPGTSKAKMSTCLSDYVTGGYTVPLFTQRSGDTPPGLYDIQLSSRVVFVPALRCDCVASPIDAFHLAFIQTLYLDPSNPACTTCLEFNPGESTSQILASKFAGLSAFKIIDTMVPASVLQTGPNGSLRGSRVALIK